MFNRRVRETAIAKMLWGLFALSAAASSHAGTLVGGGSSTIAEGYVGFNAALASTHQFYGSLGVNGIASGSLFGQYMLQAGNPGVSYCESGDGAGKNILAGITIATIAYGVQNACATGSSGNVTGFGAGIAGVNRTDLTQPNFAASDSPLRSTDLANYQTIHGASALPTQFPAIAAAIAIAFNLQDSAGTPITSSQVNFSNTQLCDIFSGTATNWSDASLASAFTLPAGHSMPFQPIHVQFRSDASGTTFSLSNYLVANCGAAGLLHPFVSSDNFAGAAGMVSNFYTVIPSTWTASSSDPAVASAIADIDFSIGYVAYANAIATNPGLQYADVNGRNPRTDFGTPLIVTSTALVYNQVIGSTDQLTPISPTPATQCIVAVPPHYYVTPGLPGGILPATSYPIVAISYLLGNAQGNEAADLASTRNLVDAPYNSTIKSNVTTVGANTGLAFLTLGVGAFAPSAPGNCLN